MEPLSSTITVDAPAAQVWDIVGRRFDRIGEWATAIPASGAATVTPPAVVAVDAPAAAPVAGRVCDTGIRALPRVTEMIVAYDEAAMTSDAIRSPPSATAARRSLIRPASPGADE
jgi:hypothetical protein